MTVTEIKQYLKDHSNVIILSLSFAFLLIGILFIFIGAYPYFNPDHENERRLTIGSICIAIWFLSFPVLDMNRKTNLIFSLAIHASCMVLSFLIFYFELIYFFNNTSGTLFKDLVACLFGILLIAYLLYIFISFLKIIFSYVKKAYNYFFTGNDSRSTLLKKTVEAITAYILSITAFGGSIVGIIAIVKQLIGK